MARKRTSSKPASAQRRGGGPRMVDANDREALERALFDIRLKEYLRAGLVESPRGSGLYRRPRPLTEAERQEREARLRAIKAADPRIKTLRKLMAALEEVARRGVPEHKLRTLAAHHAGISRQRADQILGTVRRAKIQAKNRKTR